MFKPFAVGALREVCYTRRHQKKSEDEIDCNIALLHTAHSKRMQHDHRKLY